LAARLDLREDPLRSTIEALMAGYGDTAASHTEH
jgi:hypothetical protein